MDTIRYYAKHIFFSVVILAGVILFVVVVSYVVIQTNSREYIREEIEELPQAQAAVILGASVFPNGALSPILRERVDTAIAIYESGKVKKLLVTGDNGSLSHNEVNPVRNYLLKNDIPDEDIFLDHAGFDTYSSMYRARDIFRADSIIIVSQEFHLPRAVYIARRLGLSAYGMKAGKGSPMFLNTMREVFADVKALGNLMFDRQPKYLGEEIPLGD